MCYVTNSWGCFHYFDMIGLIQSLEEETRVNTYLMKDKLPNEIQLKKKSVNQLQRVVSEPAMGQSDLDAISKKVENILVNSYVGVLCYALVIIIYGFHYSHDCKLVVRLTLHNIFG